MNGRIYIIGCGGVGSWITPSLARLVGAQNLTLIDGDTLEKKNLDRQLFSAKDIGRNKAEALGAMFQCSHMPDWFSFGLSEYTPDDLLVTCVDNNAARRDVLEECDRCGCQAVFAANETFSAEAYWYHPEWSRTPCDPRVYYPRILTDDANDPRARGIGCTGEAQLENRQLVSANFMAGALAQHLIILWRINHSDFDQEARQRLPHRLFANMTRLGQHVFGDCIPTLTVPL